MKAMYLILTRLLYTALVFLAIFGSAWLFTISPAIVTLFYFALLPVFLFVNWSGSKR
ncbi:hypothetical protein SONE68_1902 [Lacticaseibacillus paracasei]|nr:hypothetical protein SONE68_1902 [Lacticaseibacillus paracasei]